MPYNDKQAERKPNDTNMSLNLSDAVTKIIVILYLRNRKTAQISKSRSLAKYASHSVLSFKYNDYLAL